MSPSCALLGGFAISARVALLWQHYGNGNAWQSPALIRQAHRTPHAVPRTTHAGEVSPKIDAPAACAVSFRPYCGGVVTRTRNVSEYMLVLAVGLCLVAECDANKSKETYCSCTVVCAGRATPPTFCPRRRRRMFCLGAPPPPPPPILVGAPPICGLREVYFLPLTVVRQSLALMLATANYFCNLLADICLFDA